VRVYLVTVRGRVEDDTARRIEQGIVVGGDDGGGDSGEDGDGERLQAKRVTIRKRSNRETHLVVELIEGKNREIRRLMQASGHEVTRLARVSFGALELGDLAPGRWRVVRDTELARLWPEAPARPTRTTGTTAHSSGRRAGLKATSRSSSS
jgi:pseudouridine synthase